MGTPATVIIGDHTQGLGILRSAAMAGAEVWVVNDRTVSLARCSKYLVGYKRIPRGMLRHLDRDEVAGALVKILLKLPVEYPSLLCGVNEDIISFIYRHRRLLAKRYAIADVRFDTIFDKYALNALLPEQARIETRLCSEVDLQRVGAPHRFILKGRQGNTFRHITGRKAVRLDRVSPQAREDLFTRIAPDQVLMQQLVETDTPVASVCSFSVMGQPSGVFAYEKLRQHPAQFGTGTCLRSIHAGALMPLADQLLRRTRFTGISEIELVLDSRTNTYKVVEMNPRTWKSIHFATQCGQNLVERYLTYLACGHHQPSERYAIDRYWVDLATDLPQMIRRMTLVPLRPGFFECTWDKADPWPAFVLWTLFPLIALENRVCSTRPRLPKALTCLSPGESAEV